MRDLPDDERIDNHFGNVASNSQFEASFRTLPVLNFAEFKTEVESRSDGQPAAAVARIGSKLSPMVSPVEETPNANRIFRKRMQFVVLGGIQKYDRQPEEIGMIRDDSVLTAHEKSLLKDISNAVSKKRKSIDTLLQDINNPEGLFVRMVRYPRGEDADGKMRHKLFEFEAMLGVMAVDFRACVYTTLIEDRKARAQLVRGLVQHQKRQLQQMTRWMSNVRSLVRADIRFRDGE